MAPQYLTNVCIHSLLLIYLSTGHELFAYF